MLASSLSCGLVKRADLSLLRDWSNTQQVRRSESDESLMVLPGSGPQRRSNPHPGGCQAE
jgi:hypothetical protein